MSIIIQRATAGEYRGIWIPKEKQETSLHQNTDMISSCSGYLPIPLGARKAGAGVKRYESLNLSLTSQWYLRILSQTQPAFECNLGLEREIGCVYPNKKTGSSSAMGSVTAEVTSNLWLIYSVRKAPYRDGQKHQPGHC